MNRPFKVSRNRKSQMNCSDNAPCHCYGEVCLVSDTKKCNEGNVYVDAVPFCSEMRGWELMGDLVCKILGFKGLKTAGQLTNGR